jgi:hypothetical protein
MWLFLVLFLLLLFGIALWLLLSPLTLKIDTDTGVYQMRYGRIANAKVLPEKLAVRLWVFFWKKEYSLYDWKPGKEQKKARKNKKKKQGASKQIDQFQKWKPKIMGVIRAIRVKVFRLDIDTDDFVVNSYLYPVCHYLDKGRKQITVNYRGDATLKFTASVVPFRVLKALIFN